MYVLSASTTTTLFLLELPVLLLAWQQKPIFLLSLTMDSWPSVWPPLAGSRVLPTGGYSAAGLPACDSQWDPSPPPQHVRSPVASVYLLLKPLSEALCEDIQIREWEQSLEGKCHLATNLTS